MLTAWSTELLERRAELQKRRDAHQALARPRPDWLNDAYDDPAAFWTLIAAELVAAAPGVSRSAVFEWYDLYHELGQRHGASKGAAFVDYTEGSGFQSNTYATLSEEAARLAGTWRADHGVAPGDSICIVMRTSPAYIRVLLAAFHCGAVVSALPPEGRQFVRAAVKALAPVQQEAASSQAAGEDEAETPRPLFVVLGVEVGRWLEGEKNVVSLPWGEAAQRGGRIAPSHRYTASDPAVRWLSPINGAVHEAVTLSAEHFYLSALRDGLFLLELSPDEGIAAPGMCEIQFKPALLFACLASGARWVELSQNEIGDDGAVLLSGEVQVLGIRAQVRDRLLKRDRLPRNSIKRWFRNIAEDENTRAWSALGKAFADVGAPGMSYFANTAAGGSLFFSEWTMQVVSASVWRAPGVPCELTEPNGTGMPKAADVGMLSPLGKLDGVEFELTQAALGNIVISVTPEFDVWVGNLGSHRRAQWLPELLIEELLRQQDQLDLDVRASVLVPMPRSHTREGAQVVSLVFLHPDAELSASTESKLERELLDLLQRELGSAWVPDGMHLYRLNPPLSKRGDLTSIDRPACATQFQSGLLWLKHAKETFRHLAYVLLEAEQVRDCQRAQEARPEGAA